MKKYILRWDHWTSQYELWRLNQAGEYNQLCCGWFGSYDFETLLKKESQYSFIVKITNNLLDIIEPGDLIKTKKSSKPFIWDGEKPLKEKNITYIWKKFLSDYRLTYRDDNVGSGIYHCPSQKPEYMLYDMMGTKKPEPKKWKWEG